METTTHSTSEGNVLPSTDHDNDFEELSREGNDATRPALTFEQRTIRTLLAFERKRLAMQRTELEMERERLHGNRLDHAYETIRRDRLFITLGETGKALLPQLVPLLTKLVSGAAVDADTALSDAIADVVSEFPDLKETLEGRVRARREAESRAAVG